MLVGGVGVAVGDVPDARLTVEDVTVQPDAPAPDTTTTVDVTVANSVGSASPASVDTVALREGNETHAVATGVGALSPGDDVTVPLSTAFDTAGVYDLTIAVNGTDDTGESVTVTRPLRLVVGGVDEAGIDNDIEVDVREARPGDFGDDGDVGVDLDVGDVGGLGGVLGGAAGAADADESTEESGPVLGESVVVVEVTNFGSATARNVVVDPEPESVARQALADIDPGETAHAPVDLSVLAAEQSVNVSARYTLGTTPFASTTTYEYRPDRPAVTLTDVDLVSDGEQIEITGNVGNVGTEDASGVIVRTETTDDVGPTYPRRSYFVGSVPESDFVGFELTARADPVNATTVPVTVTYTDDGVERQETVELPYEPRDGSVEESGTTIAPFAVLTVLALGLVSVGAVVWRRRDTPQE